MRFHREGYKLMALGALPFILALVAMVIWGKSAPWVTGFFVLATFVFAFLVWQFFRVPKRGSLGDEMAVASPCDGKVVAIEDIHEHEFIDAPARQISIFMSPLNVHINWYPVSGTVAYSKYHPGSFLVAWHPKSSTDNERTTVVVQHEKGMILFRQIAGAVARRIVCYSRYGDTAKQAGEMGFIKFGSRVDVIIPRDMEVTVNIGDKVQGRLTPLARWS